MTPEQADELFSLHYTTVARWCYRFTGEPETAADLTQDVFLKAHRNLDSFEGLSRFSTWLYSIARNEWLNRAPAEAMTTVDAEAELLETAAPDPTPEEEVLTSNHVQRLHDFLGETLDPIERTVFTMHYADEIPLDAITSTLNLDNASGAKAYIVSAKRKLARALDQSLWGRLGNE